MKTPIQQAAAAMGRVKSERKTAACQANGAKGGRPKKETVRLFKTRNGFWQAKLESGEIAEGLLRGGEFENIDHAMASIRRRSDLRPVRDRSLDRSI